MLRVYFKVIEIGPAQGAAVNDEQILGIPFFRRPGEIEAASDDPARVDNHHLVVSNGVGTVHKHGNPGLLKALELAALGRALRFVQDNRNIYPSGVGLHQGRIYGGGGKAVCKDMDCALGLRDCAHYSLFRTTLG